ncbi:hypothetical protein JYU34_013246 [Plutella xylostella]|uniref:receptor protein-tyrosine kinase n=1 Tax=Plutella xylostella TaxID=51655 RepID=A0ABQ7Q9E8_PLUXY|nr:hypothetical protein JYU34_013246 [Plutella xylostella]
MAATKTVTWSIFLLTLTCSLSQRLGSDSYHPSEVCRGQYISSVEALHGLRGCTVIVGNLKILLLERQRPEDYSGISFPQLREITGYMLVYRVSGLESLGQLFPSLARIRGDEVYGDFALIVYDLQDLAQIGLHSLIKIDRGGVIVGGGPMTCYVDTVDWQAIAPKARHVLLPNGRQTRCNVSCRCTLRADTDHCWNNRRCQRYVTGPDKEQCHEQCFGCRRTNPADCSVCRHYTHHRLCVSACPRHTLILEANKYCVSYQECMNLRGWPWDGRCVFKCPVDFKKVKLDDQFTCLPCPNCPNTCRTQNVITLRDIALAEKCKFINGSLTIHLRTLQKDSGGIEELRLYLGRIEEVSDFIYIYGTNSIISLDFLYSLKRIGGRILKDKKYSLVIDDMDNLQSLFTANVTKNLRVDSGTLKVLRNPMLCVSEINKLKKKFPVEPLEIDIPPGMNGNSAGGCNETDVGLTIQVINETSALVKFTQVDDHSLHYSILYVRVSPTAQTIVVPESCSELEWFAIYAEHNGNHTRTIELNSLKPASTYAICIETESYDSNKKVLSRSPIANFSTPVGKPAPPFVTELVAYSSDAAVIRWVDHKDYKRHITHYELDVRLIEISDEDAQVRNHCVDTSVEDDNDGESRHAIVLKPPAEYDDRCESMCGVLSSVTKGAMLEEDFDLCGDSNDCDFEEDIVKYNSTLGPHVKTLALDIGGNKTDYQVGGLAPYRDYRFRLRACTSTHCSRTTRSVIRTFPSVDADYASIDSAAVDEDSQIYVKWQRPAISNGPVLAYSVQVFPDRKYSEIGNLMPQAWCVGADRLEALVRSVDTHKYKVRVCTVSLASSTCTDWVSVVKAAKAGSWWWSGILVGVLLCVVSSVAARLYRPRVRYSDHIMLLDATSEFRNESEPPAIMMTDFATIYSIPLTETYLFEE